MNILKRALSTLLFCLLLISAVSVTFNVRPAYATTNNFGYGTVGASTYETFGHNQKWTCRFQVNITMTLNTITAYSWCDDATTDFILCIYDDTNGSPTNRLGYANVSLLTSAGWRTSSTFSGSIYVYNQSYYWLGIQDYGEINWHIQYDSGVTNQTARNSDSAPPDDPFGSGITWNAYKFSIYATGTVENPAPTIDNIIIKGQKTGTSTTVAVHCTALGGATLSTISLYWNRTGSYANVTASMSGTSGWENFTGTLSNVGDNVNCRVYVNDSLNTWTTSSSFSFNIFADTMATYVDGNKMYNGNGTAVVFKGFDYTYFMDTAIGSWYDPTNGNRFYDFTKTMEEGMNYTLDFLVASGGNYIRVIGTVQYWVDNTESYRTSIARFCELARARGIYFMFTFWRVNSSQELTVLIPWNDVGNGYVENANAYASMYDTVSDALKGYDNFVTEYWNEPDATAEWFNCVQSCLTYSRSIGINNVVDIACAPDGNPLTYDFNPESGYTSGFQDVIPIALTYLNDTSFNLIFDMHAYWANAYTSVDYSYKYLYDDVVTWLNKTGCYLYSATYVLNIGEIGFDNSASLPTNQLAWLNNSMSIFDDLGIGYEEWAGPPWENETVYSNQWGFTSNDPNFTLTNSGNVWLNHLGGETYAEWLDEAPASVSLTVTSPTNTTYSSNSISVSLSASGGTIDKIWWNCKNGTNWIYGSNATYTVPTSMTGFVNGTSYMFYGWANNTVGNSDEKTVGFSVQIPPVTISITLPANTTYSSGTITVNFTASGGTIDDQWYNCKNGSSWIYGSNQTYSSPTSMTGFVNGTSYTLYVFANNTDGNSGQSSVGFSVQIITGSESSLHFFAFLFKDRDGNIVNSLVSWKLYNASTLLQYVESEYTLVDGTYTLKTYYGLSLINQTDFATATYGNSTVHVYLEMKSHYCVSNGYLVFNATVTSLVVDSQTPQNLTFTLSGSTPMLMYVVVPQNASYVQKNGANQTGWTYSTSPSPHILVETSSLSTWSFVFPSQQENEENPPGGGLYRVVFRAVGLSGLPIQNVNITVGGVSRFTDILGLAVFNLPYGDHQIVATFGNETKKLNVFVNGEKTYGLPFNYDVVGVGEKFSPRVLAIPVVLLVVCLVCLMLPRKRSRR